MAESKQVGRLREALAQLSSFKSDRVNAHSPEFKAWQQRTHRTLHDLFGAGQYLRGFSNLHFCEPRVHVATRRSSAPQWLPMDQARFDGDTVLAEQLLRDAIEDVGVPPSDGPHSDDSPMWGVIHPKIAEVAQERFENGHYADAAETAFKAVNTRVKGLWKATGEAEKDGKNLMLSAFSVNRPVIRLDDLSTESGKNIQEGYMHIFAGAMQAIRNPKAHEIITISPERAIHFLVLASLLMSKLDEATA
jgi:uncharacterized protein (TIGR02391 family)